MATEGLLPHVHAADIQDRDGSVLLIGTVFADSGYQGPKFQQALRRVFGPIRLEIVKRSELAKFVVLPKRWIVERTIAWLNPCRRLAKDWECRNQNALAFLRSASIRLMLKRLSQDRE